MARPVPFDDLAAKLASNGPAALHDELTRFVTSAAARGATPSLLSILADESQPDVARQRAFGRIAVELSHPRLDTAHRVPETSNAAWADLPSQTLETCEVISIAKQWTSDERTVERALRLTLTFGTAPSPSPALPGRSLGALATEDQQFTMASLQSRGT
jgi:hypothetical protein